MLRFAIVFFLHSKKKQPRHHKFMSDVYFSCLYLNDGGKYAIVLTTLCKIYIAEIEQRARVSC